MKMKLVSIIDVCDFQGGSQPPKNEWSNKPLEDYTRMLQIRDFTQGNLEFIAYVKDTSKLRRCEKDDVLIGRYGASVGKILTGLSGAYNVAIMKTIPDPKRLDKKFLYFLLKDSSFQVFIQSVGARAAQAGFSKNDLKKFKFYLPESLEDQKKIANLLSQIENLIIKREKSIELLDQLIKSTFLDMFGSPISNSKKWEKTILGKLGTWKSGGTPSRVNPDFYKGNIPWVSSGELNKMFISSSNEHITEEAILNSNTKLIEEGSLLLGMYDTAALKSSINTIKLTCNQAIAFSKLDERKCNTYFIYHLIQIGKDYFKRFQRGVRQKNMNITMVKNIPIILPPNQLQDKFAEIVIKIENTKKIYQNSLDELKQLFGSVSQKAFKGELDLSKFELNLEVNKPIEIIKPKKEKIKEVKKNEKSLLNKIVDIGLIIGGTALTAYTAKKLIDNYNKDTSENLLENKNIIQYDEEVELEFDEIFLKNFIKMFQEKEPVSNNRLMEELNKIGFKNTPKFNDKKEAFIKLLDKNEIEQYNYKDEVIAFRIKE